MGMRKSFLNYDHANEDWSCLEECSGSRGIPKTTEIALNQPWFRRGSGNLDPEDTNRFGFTFSLLYL